MNQSNDTQTRLTDLRESLYQDPQFLKDNWGECYPIDKIKVELGIFIKYHNDPNPTIFNQILYPLGVDDPDQYSIYHSGIYYGQLIEEICRDFRHMLTIFTARRGIFRSMHDLKNSFDPYTDWLLFSTTPLTCIDCENHPTYRSWRVAKIDAFHFMINIYMELFEILLDCPFYSNHLYNNKPPPYRLPSDRNIIADCYYNFILFRKKYYIYKAAPFSMLKNSTIRNMSRKFISNMSGVFVEGTVIPPETSSIETTITLSSNILRRSVEFII